MKMTPRTYLWSGVAALWCAGGLGGGVAKASAFTDYLAGYNLGIDFYTNVSATGLAYQAPLATKLPPGCSADTIDATKMDCSVLMGNKDQTMVGLELEHSFQRQGWFLFTGDLGLSTVWNKASYVSSPTNGPTQPLTSASVEVYGLAAKAYLEFGITPPKWLPDVILSFGIAGEANFGQVTVEGQSTRIQSLAPGVYEGLQVVWWRFAKDRGAISTYFDLIGALDSTKVNYSGSDGLTNIVLAHLDGNVGLQVMTPL